MYDASIETQSSFRAVRVLVCMLFLTFAMTSDAVGGIVAQVIGQMHLTLTAASAFQYVPMGAMALGAVALGGVADRFGRKPAILGGLALYGGASLLFAFGHRFGFFVGLLAMTGIGISLFKTGALALIGDLSWTGVAHTRMMNAAEGFFGIGSIIGPALVGVLTSVGLSWTWLYVAAAAICLALLALSSVIAFPHRRVERRAASAAPDVGAIERATTPGSTLRVLRDPYALGFAALIMLYVAVESAVYVWMPTYIRAYKGPASWLSLYGLTIFFILRAGGRFLGVWLLRQLRWTAMLALCALFILACFAGALLGGVAFGAWLLPLSGLAMSVVYPTLNSKGISGFPRSQHGAAAGVLLAFTALAAALGPLAMGAVSDAYHAVRFGFALATVFALLLFIGLLVNWIADPTRRRLCALEGAEAKKPCTPADPSGAAVRSL